MSAIVLQLFFDKSLQQLISVCMAFGLQFNMHVKNRFNVLFMCKGMLSTVISFLIFCVNPIHTIYTINRASFYLSIRHHVSIFVFITNMFLNSWFFFLLAIYENFCFIYLLFFFLFGLYKEFDFFCL